MKITDKRLDEIKPYENNPRLNKEAVKFVKNSIRKFGFKVPIVIDKDNVIVAGHTRYLASKELNLETVPCVVADDLTEKQIKAFRLADNKTAEKDDEEEECTVQPGDIYKLGEHRLMCGDSTDSETIGYLMDGAEADMVLSDPPYGMHLDTDFSGAVGSLKSIGRKKHTRGNKYEKVIGDNDDFTPELISTFFDNFGYCSEMFLFGADYYAELLEDKNLGSWLVWDKRKESQADAIGSEFELIWSRTKHKRRMLRHDWFGFLSSQNASDARNRVHPTQKPVTLLADIINQWGKNADIIVDLYGGSGSTLIACEQLNRQCYMMEYEPKFVDVIIKRWEEFTGEKAVKL